MKGSHKYSTLVTLLLFLVFSTFINGVPDPYRVLGVTRTASATELKQAYKKLVLLHHPDKVRACTKLQPQHLVK